MLYICNHLSMSFPECQFCCQIESKDIISYHIDNSLVSDPWMHGNMNFLGQNNWSSGSTSCIRFVLIIHPVIHSELSKSLLNACHRRLSVSFAFEQRGIDLDIRLQYNPKGIAPHHVNINTYNVNLCSWSHRYLFVLRIHGRPCLDILLTVQQDMFHLKRM